MNRCLAEGRERFRAFLTRSESGGRCAELRPVLSAFCDGEASAEETSALREHLRACAHCRAAMRAYRAAPGAAAALAPLPIVARPLLERAHEAFAGLQTRLPGRGGVTETSMSQVAVAGGSRGAGVAVLTKALAICAGTVGGAAVCVGAGVIPAPLGLDADRAVLRPHAEPVAESLGREVGDRPIVGPTPKAIPDSPEPERDPVVEAPAPQPVAEEPPSQLDASAELPAPSAPAPPPEPAPAPSSPAAATQAVGGSAAGEFGP